MASHKRAGQVAIRLAAFALAACVAPRAQPAQPVELGCGTSSDAQGIADYARSWLFPRPTASPDHVAAAARLRGLFYPDLQPGHPIHPVTDPAECARVIAAFRRDVPDVAAQLRPASDSAPGGRGFAIVRIGHYYHLATRELLPPGTIMFDGGESWMARLSASLEFMRVLHGQF